MFLPKLKLQPCHSQSPTDSAGLRTAAGSVQPQVSKSGICFLQRPFACKRLNSRSKTQTPVQPHTSAAHLYYPAARAGAWQSSSKTTATFMYSSLKKEQKAHMSWTQTSWTHHSLAAVVICSCLHRVLPCIQEASHKWLSSISLKTLMNSGLQNSLGVVKGNYFFTVFFSFFSN